MLPCRPASTASAPASAQRRAALRLHGKAAPACSWHGRPILAARQQGTYGRRFIQHRVAQVDAPAHEQGPAAQAQPQQGSESFTWTRCWYPVLPETSLDPSRPIPLTLLGKDLVVWRDGSGSWRCFQDACPHRLAPLSEGRVEKDGTLACSYHGWRFDSKGACTTIPQAENPASAAAACSSKRSCVSSYPTRFSGGLLWVWADASPSAEMESTATPLPIPEPLQKFMDAGGEVSWYMRDLPHSFDTLVENLTDPAHLPFVHHGAGPTLNRSKGSAMPLRPYKPPPTQPAGAPSDSATAADAAAGIRPVISESYPSYQAPETVLEFFAPGLTMVRFDVPNTDPVVTNILCIWGVPTAPGKSRLLQTSVFTPNQKLGLWDVLKLAGKPAFGFTFRRFIFQSFSPLQIHMFVHKIVDQDTVILTKQEERLVAAIKAHKDSGARGSPPTWADLYFLPTSSDRAVVQVRRWIDAVAGGPFGAGKGYRSVDAPRLTQEEMLDRFEQHTKHCMVCKAQLKKSEATLARAPLLGGLCLLALCALLGTFGLQGLMAGGWQRVAAAVAGVGALLSGLMYKSASDTIQKMHYVPWSHADNH